MKTCTRCKLEKEESEFYKSGKGLKTRCIVCVKAYCKTYNEAHKEKHNTQSKTYHEANKEKLNAYAKAYREANRDKIDAHLQSQKGKYNVYKSSAKARNIPFNLTKEEFLTFWQADCYYCNRPIATIGIDRIDSLIGYSLDNCVSCCSTCNYMKSDTDKEAWFSNMLMVLKHQGII